MNPKDEQIPLWRQLSATATVIQAVREGVSGTAALETVPAELRPGVQSLAFHVWRNMGRAQALRKLLAAKLPPPQADALLCVALALAWSDAQAPYDMFTLVNQTVEAAKRGAGTHAQANFLNACLRRFLRERDALVAQTDADPVAVWNHPGWWIKRLQKEQSSRWREVLAAANCHAPMTLRVNPRKATPNDYLAALQSAGIAVRANSGATIVLDQPVGVQRLPGFEQGWVSVQDTAAQMAVPLLLDGLPEQAHMRILDACAAPGGKTAHLLELSQAHVLALEIDAVRTRRITENLARLQLQAQVVTADASRPQDWWDGQPFDAILLDAPCTASGIVRRHPDVRWLRRETDIAQLAAIQKRMLQALWGLLRPGGSLLYCTCSLFLAEGDGQVQTFLTHNTDAVLLPSPGHLMPQNVAKADAVPDNGYRDHDGFYYALLQKQMA
ncbi:16S rRNA (cytosine(967)-C(5))-methyltransferase RsmB [Rhodoferax sp. AJA081-3]|uniref:16S rRNA (cytosine(967)-C(5))-methyltransferase RsmB n=1 Tax=Rhodoferax sp. AJA081-3 TaxID=2752316 RepID=UPI001ADFACDC|nr:16S rRNA (cytosine(967)-C(5))-methyltransferase RsmB [Rhodoferax sp. AJA081-3]QTN30329.1 16S rRNA (cytosine(967)-C(5))-methyltransferase RsmB [Rhodoferax sp. AJA081-3]